MNTSKKSSNPAAEKARDYLACAAETATGRQVLTDLGLAHVADYPRKGDDTGSIKVAELLRTELNRRYGF